MLASMPHVLTIAVAHNKGGVGKTTTTLLLGRFLADRRRVALADYDETAHLTALVADLAAVDDERLVSPRLWLEGTASRPTADVRLIDSPPSRSIDTEQALAEADYVLIPAPPERMALRALQQMLHVIATVRASGANPYLQTLGVVPTMVRRAWAEHAAYLDQISTECRQHQVRVFPAIPSRQSYLWLSKAGQDYRPVAEAVEALLGEHAGPPPQVLSRA